jgi:hypothetical protein
MHVVYLQQPRIDSHVLVLKLESYGTLVAAPSLPVQSPLVPAKDSRHLVLTCSACNCGCR